MAHQKQQKNKNSDNTLSFKKIGTLFILTITKSDVFFCLLRTMTDTLIAF